MHARRFLALTAAAVIAISACAPAASTAPTDTGAPPTAGPSPTEAAAEGPNAELTAALAGDYDGTTVDVVGQWIGPDEAAFTESLDAFRDATGINVVYSGISNYETVLSVRVDGGLAPDIAQLAQPGRLRAFAGDGKLIDLDTILDADTVRENYSPGFITAGSGEDGKLYGLYYQQNLKSIVWYPVQAFEAAGYEPPTTWDELDALVEKIKADGSSPWCTSIEHGDFSGWVATDWLEDVLLRTAPVETYDAWAAHELPFTDPAVVKALDFVGSMWFTEGNTYGGAERINGTWVGDSQTPMFDDPPKCWLHKQAAWIPDFWPEGKEPEVDSKFFYFPESKRSSAARSSVPATCSSCSTTDQRSGLSSSGSRHLSPSSLESRPVASSAPVMPSRPSGTTSTRCPAWPRSPATRRFLAPMPLTACRPRRRPWSTRQWSSGSRRTARAPRPSSRRSRTAGRSRPAPIPTSLLESRSPQSRE